MAGLRWCCTALQGALVLQEQDFGVGFVGLGGGGLFAAGFQRGRGRGQHDWRMDLCAVSPGKTPGGAGVALLYLRYPYFYRRMELAPTVTSLQIAG